MTCIAYCINSFYIHTIHLFITLYSVGIFSAGKNAKKETVVTSNRSASDRFYSPNKWNIFMSNAFKGIRFHESM